MGSCQGQWGHSTCCFVHTKLLKINVERNLAVQLYNLKNKKLFPQGHSRYKFFGEKNL